ncbi:MAG: nucleotidyltransferase domain-containing protein [Gemmatimonadota bacterium]|nr:nucleotidyltransferase domain-containing protein [Gemmatimonadota bacterium]
MVRVQVPRSRIAEFCRRNGIRSLSLFGSVLCEDFGPGSDVDVLTGLDPGHPVGLISLAAMELELSEILGRKVDMHTVNSLSRYFRKEVVRTAEVLYAA